MTKESDLENLLASHPYLICEEFAGLLPLRQLTYGQCRLDMAFKLLAGFCIVELKKTPLTVDDVRQLLRYCQEWSESQGSPLANHHYLIGKRPRDESSLQKAIADSRFKIKVLYLDEHIPTRLAWDDAARRYVPYDPSRYSSEYLRLSF